MNTKTRKREGRKGVKGVVRVFEELTRERKE